MLLLPVDGEGHKHPLTENAAVVQALIDNPIERGLDPKFCRLFIIDGAKALSKVIRRNLWRPHVNRFGLPVKLRRSLACTNSIENVMGTVRRVCRNVKRWRNAAMALRWTAAGMMEVAKGFRRLKAGRPNSALQMPGR